MRTTVSLSTRVPSVGFWAKTKPSSTSELDTEADLRDEPGVLDVLDREGLRDAEDVRDGDRLLALDLALDGVVEEPARDEEREYGADRRGATATAAGLVSAARTAEGGERRTICVAAVASIARSPARTIVAASAVSAATRPPRATVSRSASMAAAD